MKIERQGNLVVAKEGHNVTIDDLGERSFTVTSYEPFDLSVFDEQDIEQSHSLNLSFREGWLISYVDGMVLPKPPKEMQREIRNLPSAKDAGTYTRASINIKSTKKGAHATPEYEYSAEISDDIFEKIEKGKVESRQEKIKDQEEILQSMREDLQIKKEISKGTKEIPEPTTTRVDGKKAPGGYVHPRKEIGAE